MPITDPEKRKKYWQKYYKKHRKRLLAYRKNRREKDREIWREWYQRKKDKERKEKIKLGQIYKPKSVYK
ncbi:MAG: hypothetical protein ACTSYW_10455 [Candidatus Heimdallarchaeota archaeon]